MKIIDGTETQKKKKTKTKANKVDKSYSERLTAKRFCCAFKLGFVPLMCKSFFIFKWNLELSLSIILKERESYELKHVAKHFLMCSSILVLK